jgi:bacteriocin biosynthesis cyclodehydratase domain-containing protein
MHERKNILLAGAGNVARAALRACETISGIASINAMSVEKLSELRGDLSAYTAVALATDRPYPAAAELLSERCWSSGVAFVEATLVAHEFRVGPAVIPGRTPCYECWARRVCAQSSDRLRHDLLDEIGRRTKGAWFSGELTALNEEVAALLAAELAAIASDTYVLPERRMGRFWEGDAVFGELRSHLFARVGRCARCGGADQTDHLSKIFG